MVNLKFAKTMGLTMSPSFLARSLLPSVAVSAPAVTGVHLQGETPPPAVAIPLTLLSKSEGAAGSIGIGSGTQCCFMLGSTRSIF